jgi:hypothetical protein
MGAAIVGVQQKLEPQITQISQIRPLEEGIHRGVAESAEMVSCDMGILPMRAMFRFGVAFIDGLSSFHIATTGGTPVSQETVPNAKSSPRPCVSAVNPFLSENQSANLRNLRFKNLFRGLHDGRVAR